MSKLRYSIAKFLSKYKGHDFLLNYFRKEGMKVGKDTYIFSNIGLSEPYLISIGEHTTIATNVRMLTHDASIGALTDYNVSSDICGKIAIGDYCFIGDGAIIMYGVTIPNRTIVAAGCVVTKSIEKEGCIVAGVPAKIIGDTEDFLEKNREHFISLHGIYGEKRKEIILRSNLVER